MNIFVSNINYRTQEESLYNLFAAFGEITSCKIVLDRETGRSRGFGFVEMPNEEEANAAVEALNGKEFEEKELRVSEARAREERPRRSFDNNRGGYGRSNGGYGRSNGGYGRNNGGYGRGNGGYDRQDRQDRYSRDGGYNRDGGYERRSERSYGEDNYGENDRY